MLAVVMLPMSILILAGVVTVTSNLPAGWDRWIAGALLLCIGLRFTWRGISLIREQREECGHSD